MAKTTREKLEATKAKWNKAKAKKSVVRKVRQLISKSWRHFKLF